MPIAELMVPAYRRRSHGQFGQGADIDRRFPPDDRRVVAEPATGDACKKCDRIVRRNDYSFPCVRQLVGQQVGAKEKIFGDQRTRYAPEGSGGGSADSERGREGLGPVSLGG